MSRHRAVALALAACTAVPALAQPQPAQAPAPKPPWQSKLGFSFLKTAGNVRSTSGSFDGQFRFEHVDRPEHRWAFETGGEALLAEKGARQNAVRRSAARWHATVRAERRFARRLKTAFGLRRESDRFSGVAARTTGDVSLLWQRDGEPAKIRLLAGLSVVREEPRGGAARESLGGILQATAEGKLSPTASWLSQVTALPNFDDLEDLRLGGKLSLQAALNPALGVRLSCDLAYDAKPVPGFASLDTTTTAAIVATLGRKPGS